MLAIIWSKLGVYAAAIGGVLLAIFAYGRSQKNKGKKEVKNAVESAVKDKTIEVMKDDKEIETVNRSMSGDARRAKLRRKYTRANDDK